MSEWTDLEQQGKPVVRSEAEAVKTLASVPTTNFEDVKACHTKYGLLVGQTPSPLTQRKLQERVEFLLEELLELAAACGLCVHVDTRPYLSAVDGTWKPIHTLSVSPNLHAPTQDFPEQADALIDLAYVAMGTGVMLGLPWQPLWDDVQRANMSKVRGVTGRGHAVDLAKPPGWVAPKTQEILIAHGYDPALPERDDQ